MENEIYNALIDRNYDAITTIKEKEEELVLESTKLRMIFNLTATETFEVDCQRRAMKVSDATANKYSIKLGWIENAPDSVIADGTVHPDSKADYCGLYNDIYAGVPSGSTTVMAKKADGNYVLTKLTYSSIPDKNGNPYWAVGISEELENISDTRLAFEREKFFILASEKDLHGIFLVNVTKAEIEHLHVNGRPDLNEKICHSSNDFIKMVSDEIPNAEERTYFINGFTAENLMALYRNGEERIYTEIRHSDKNGKLTWMSIMTNLMVSPFNGDLYAFVYLRDIDKQKKFELSVGRKIEREASILQYSRETLRVLEDSILEQTRGVDRLCAIYALRVNDYFERKRTIGEYGMGAVLFSVARKMRMCLGINYLIGRVTEDTAVFFTTEITCAEEAEEVAKKLLATLRDPAMYLSVAEQYFSFSLGTFVSRTEGQDFNSLLNGAWSSLNKTSPDNPFFLLDGSKDQVEAIETEEHGVMPEVSLTSNYEASAGAILRLTELILSEKDPNRFMNRALGYVGEYYHADRAYVFEVREDNTIDNTYGWCAENISPQLENLQAVPLEDIPTFRRAYETGNGFFIQDISSIAHNSYEYEVLVPQGITSLYVIPLSGGDGVLGFLGIDNPRLNVTDKKFFHALGSFLAQKLDSQRTLEKQKYSSRYDLITGALSRNSFTEFMHRASPETMSSLGVVMADVAGLQELNSRYGNRYGDEAVNATAKTLQKHFGTNVVYRYSGGCFLVLLQDTTRELFVRSVEAAKKEFENCIQYSVAVGSTWTDITGDIDKLILEAAELMQAAKQEIKAKSAQKQDARREEALKELTAGIKSDKFLVYLQPKAEMRSCAVRGAEALCRAIGIDGKLIFPGEFIPPLEHMGIIRHIDLFVLEEVCKTLARWKKEGRRLIPVSLNFSRSTILEPRIAETVAEITDKYDVDRSLLEIEITESLGDLEWGTITDIAEKLRCEGYCLALDDFGARYSNLSILSAVQFSTLKLDKQLTDRVVSNKMTSSIIRSVVALCEEFDIEVVAEGVETDAQRMYLDALGCGTMQGYFINRPIPVKEFESRYLGT